MGAACAFFSIAKVYMISCEKTNYISLQNVFEFCLCY